jgi:hypothetical protein
MKFATDNQQVKQGHNINCIRIIWKTVDNTDKHYKLTRTSLF